MTNTDATLGYGGAKKVDKLARQYGKEFADEGIATSQLRRIYSEVKRAENQYKHDEDFQRTQETLMLLKPKLAYEASRSEEMGVVHETVGNIIDRFGVGEDPNLDLFFELMEAIVAYHAYYTDADGGDY